MLLPDHQQARDGCRECGYVQGGFETEQAKTVPYYDPKDFRWGFDSRSRGKSNLVRSQTYGRHNFGHDMFRHFFRHYDSHGKQKKCHEHHSLYKYIQQIQDGESHPFKNRALHGRRGTRQCHNGHRGKSRSHRPVQSTYRIGKQLHQPVLGQDGK